MTDIRDTQNVLYEIQAADPPDIRVTQDALYAVEVATPDIRDTQNALYVVWGFAPPMRVTQMALYAVTFRPSCGARRAQLWDIRRQDGEIKAFTTHDKPLAFRGLTYTPCNSVRASASAGLSTSGISSGDIQAAGLMAPLAVSEAELVTGAYDNARVSVWQVDWDDGGPILGARRLSHGRVADITIRGSTEFVMTVETPGKLLTQNPILPAYTPSCRWDLGDERCKVDLEALREFGVVQQVTARDVNNRARRREWMDATITQTTDYFADGLVNWTSGPNAPRISQIKSNDDGLLVLWDVLPHELEVGDTYTITPGCLKRRDEDCNAKFDNVINFGGFPDVPGEDAFRQTPNAKA